MCGNPFKSHDVQPAPPPAVSVAAPTKTNVSALDTRKDNHDVKAKGKRRLTIPVGSSGGTGVNV